MSRITRAVIVFAAASAFSFPRVASATDWRVDPNHMSVTFKIRHMMVTWVRGEFAKVSGKAFYDPKNPGSARVDVAIEAASINTNNERRDNHLRSDDFLLVEQHPKITFKSKAVKNIRPGGFDLVGDLTIRGVTKEVVLQVSEVTPPIVGPRKDVRMGASASTRINRKEFGVKYNRLIDTSGVVVGDEVHIILDVQLIRES